MQDMAVWSRFALAFALVCLAAALAYFSYAVLTVVKLMPETLAQVESTTESIQPALEQVGPMLELVPRVLDETAALREQVPAILAEVKATREMLPPILERIDAVHGDIPTVLAEVKAVRTDVVPPLLAESAATREMVPLALTRVEAIVDQADGMVKTMGEDAVSGFLTGIVKTPVNLLSSVGKKLIPDTTGATEADRKRVFALITEMASRGEVDVTRRVTGETSGFNADVTIRDHFISGDSDCYKVHISSRRKKADAVNTQIEICQQPDGEWKLKK